MSRKRNLSPSEVRKEANEMARLAIDTFIEIGGVTGSGESATGTEWTEADTLAIENRLAEIAHNIAFRRKPRRRR